MQYRQGDIFIESIPTIPTEAEVVPREDGKIVLAYGEVTGHAHVIADRGAELLKVESMEDRFLSIMAASGVELRHEEHAPIKLPPGNYVVRRQREYIPNESEQLSRQVTD